MDLTTRPHRTGAIALLSVLLIAAGCGNAASTPTPAPTPSPTAIPSPTPAMSLSASVAPGASIAPGASVTPSGSPMVTSAQVCADLAAFQASLDSLKGLDLATAGILGTLDAVRVALTSGQAFVQSSRAAFGPEAQALGTALGGLQTAIAGLTGSSSLGDKAATIENAIDDVATAFDALKAKVSPRCPAASPGASPAASPAAS